MKTLFGQTSRTSATAALVGVLLAMTWASPSGASTAPGGRSAPAIARVDQVWLTDPSSMATLSAASSTLAGTFLNRPDSYQWMSYIPEGWSTSPYVTYGSYADFKADIDAGNGPSVELVMYDPERWPLTPTDEQQRPRYYMQLFGTLAHAHGYKVVNAPAMNLLTVPGGSCIQGSGEDLWVAYVRCQFPRYAAQNADSYDIQTQRWQCDASLWPSRNPGARPSLVQTYQTRVRQAVNQATAANESIEVYSGLSTEWCAPSGSDLFAAWGAVRTIVAGHFIHMEEPNILAAVNFLNLVAPVIVGDAAVTPSDFVTRQGATVTWRVEGAATAPHSIVDGSGMGMFDSGAHGPGHEFRRVFRGAGMYPVVDAETGHSSFVILPTRVSPSSGDEATSFTVQASTTPAPPGFVYDTQVQGPGDLDFVTWKSGYSLSFTADQGPGPYAFRSRLRRKSNGQACEWSPGVSVDVG